MRPQDVPLPRAAAADWVALSTVATTPTAFDPAALAGLPGPARRWLSHAIAPGTPAWTSAQLGMTGQIRLGGRWRSFTARQVLAPGRGFVWSARVRVGWWSVSGFDRYTTTGGGQLRWRLLGVLPVVSASGPDITASAAGRLAGEAVLVPTACLGASWSAEPGPDTAVLSWSLHGQREEAVLRVGPGGRLREVVLQRWGDPGGAPFGRHPFGVAFEGETVFSGVRVPSALRAGWWWGSDRQDEGEFFRARITEACFR